MTNNELKKIAKEVGDIIENSKPTLFVKDKYTEIPPEDLLYEMRATIVMNVGLYFYRKLR